MTGGAEQTFLDTLFIALLPAIPVAVGLLLTYLKAKQNELEISNRPTHDQVSTAIQNKATEILATNGDTTGGK